MQVVGFNDQQGGFQLTLVFAEPPVNDDLADAAVIPPLSFVTVTGTEHRP